MQSPKHFAFFYPLLQFIFVWLGRYPAAQAVFSLVYS